MSNAFPPEKHAELRELIFALHDQSISPENSARLEAWICRDKEACRAYVKEMNLYARLHWDRKQEPRAGQASPQGGSAARTPVLGFLGDVFESGGNFLGRSLVLSLLVTVALPCIILLVLLVQINSQRSPHSDVGSAPAAVAKAPVAQVTRVHQCVWAEDSEAVSEGTFLLAGQRLCLSEGLAEVVFGDRSRVLLQGPATLDAINANEAALRAGSLVANVPRGAEGFTVRTPTAKVVDLGTEFGVYVEDDGRMADVQVFQGEVELTASVTQKDLACYRLTAGRAIRIERAGPRNAARLREITPLADRFVRAMPPPADPPKAKAPVRPTPAIVADFSGGNGKLRVDQFTGIPGPGWATAWKLKEHKAAEFTASVEDVAPIRDGGNYLKVQATRRSGDEWAGGAVVRRFRSGHGVDISKPYVISFDLRVDELERFDTDNDSVGIHAGPKPDNDTRPGSGWAIRASGNDLDGISPRRWKFFDGDGNGNYSKVDSGIDIEEGAVYSFRVLVDPVANIWKPSMNVNGGEFKTFKELGIRSANTPQDPKSWTFLHFHWHLRGGNKGEAKERVGFSIDSIRIAPAENEE
jgi:hypothetical protein